MKRLQLWQWIRRWWRQHRGRRWESSHEIDSHRWESKMEMRRRLSDRRH